MSNFFLIDQSLCKGAGHHFDYTLCIANESQRNGFNTVVGTHRSFEVTQEIQQLFGSSDIKPVFQNTTYNRLSYLPGLRMPTRSKNPPDYRKRSRGWLSRFRQNINRQKRDQYLAQFQDDCHELLANHRLQQGDQIFFVTISEIEWLGLARFIATLPGADLVQWHLQFHFELFLGLPTEYEKSAAEAQQVNAVFEDASQLTKHANIRFYTTSNELTEQYNRLDVETFETLAYPVNPTFLQNCEPTNNSKVILTCAGGIRREKGIKSYLPDLANSVTQCPQLKSKIEIVVQGKPKNLPLTQRKKCSSVIRWEPLPAAHYDQLIYQTDIGLLMYDAKVFASRRSSVLGEFLSCGKPIIVTAGSWLHKQIAKPIEQHRKHLFDASLALDEIDSPFCSDQIACDPQRAILIPLKNGDSNQHRVLNVCLDWSDKNPFGTYCHVEFQMLVDGIAVSRKQDIVAPITAIQEKQPREVFVSAEIPPRTTEVHIKLSNAFASGPLMLNNLQFGLIENDQPIPTGVIGVPVANNESIIDAIRYMLKHLDHYRQTAEENAWSWRAKHAPAKTVGQLLKKQPDRKKIA